MTLSKARYLGEERVPGRKTQRAAASGKNESTVAIMKTCRFTYYASSR